MAKKNADASVIETPAETPAPTPSANGARLKTTCSLTRSRFAGKAQPVNLTINGHPLVATVKEFSTGSFGWNVNGKVMLEVDGVKVPVQVGGNLIVVGSKEAAE